VNPRAVVAWSYYSNHRNESCHFKRSVKSRKGNVTGPK
jgi:hypothetical protein